MEASELKALEERLQPKYKYAQALAFAFPFFIGMAVLWLFLKADIDRQYDQTYRETVNRLTALAEASASKLEAKIMTVDMLLLGLREQAISRTEDGFRGRAKTTIKTLKSTSGANDVQVFIVDANGEHRWIEGSRAMVNQPWHPLKGLESHFNRKDQLTIYRQASQASATENTLFFFRQLTSETAGGLVAISIDDGYFKTLRDSYAQFGQMRVRVLSDHGTELFEADSGRTGRATVRGSSQQSDVLGLLPQAVKPPRSSEDSLATLDRDSYGEESLFVWRSVGGYPAMVFVGQPTARAFDGYEAVKLKYVLFGISISILFVASLYWFFAFRYSAEQSEIRQKVDYEIIKRSERELAASRQSLRELAAHQISLKEQERKRIALEIHDELGQRMTALRLEVAMVERRLTAHGESSAIGALTMIKAQIDQVIEIVRDVALKLRPASLDIGLSAAVDGLLRDFRHKTDISVEFNNQLPDGFQMPEEQTTTVFRILQESLTNISRHAKARYVTISFWIDDQNFLMEVTDDGVGFDLSVAEDTSSTGISGMRERVFSLGGRFTALADPGHGCCIRVSIPLSSGESSEAPDFARNDPLSHLRSE